MLYGIKKHFLLFFIVAFFLFGIDINASTISSSINGKTDLEWNMGEPDFQVYKINLQLDTKNDKTKLVLTFDSGIMINSYPDENTPAMKEYLKKVIKKTVGDTTILEFEFKDNVIANLAIEIGIRLNHGLLDLEDNVKITSNLFENDTSKTELEVKINTYSHLTPILTFLKSNITPGQKFNYSVSHFHSIKENTSIVNTGAYGVTNTYTEIYVPKGISVVNPTKDRYLDESDAENPKIIFKNWKLYDVADNNIVLKADNLLETNQILQAEKKSCFSATYSNKSNRTFCVDSPIFNVIEEKDLAGTIPLYNSGIDSNQELLASITLENIKPYDLTNLKIDFNIPDGFRPTAFSFGDKEHLNITFPITVEYTTNLDSEIKKVTIVSDNTFFSSDKLSLKKDEYLKEFKIYFPTFKQSAFLKQGYSSDQGFKLFGDIASKYESGQAIKDNDSFMWEAKISSDEISTPTTIRAKKNFTNKKISQLSLMATTLPNKSIYYAGDKYNLTFTAGIGRYNGSTRIVNPEFYLRIPDFLIYDIESLTQSLKEQGLYPKITTYLDKEKNNVIKISFYGVEGDKTYFNKSSIDLTGNELNEEAVLIKMELNTIISPLADPMTIDLVDEFKMFSVNLDKVTNNQTLNLFASSTFVDTYGIVDDNSNSNLGQMKSINVGLNSFKLENVKTFKSYAITKSTSDTQWLIYNGNESTVSKYYAAKQDTGIYKLIIKNNLGQSYDNYVMYIPVPKVNDTAKNKWSMSLSEQLSVISGDASDLDISYTNSKTPDTNELSGGVDSGYFDTVTNYNDITMIKIKISELKNSADYEIDINLKIDDSEIDNAYNELVYLEAKYSANLNGTQTPIYQVANSAAILIPASITGVVFEDSNYNSKNDDNKFLENVNVELYDVNDIDNVLTSSKTMSDGSYEFMIPTFKENKDFNGKYVVKFIKPDGYIAAVKEIDGLKDNSLIDETSLISEELSLKDNNQKINAGFGKDAEINVSPLEHNNVKVGDSYSTISTYLISNGTFNDCTISDATIFKHKINNNVINFTALKKGNTTAILTFKDGYGRTRTDLNKVISLKSVLLEATFYGKVKFVNNNGKVVDVSDKYLKNYRVNLKSNNNVIAFTDTNEKGEYEFTDLELLDGDYELEIIKPVSNKLDYVEVMEKHNLVKSVNSYNINNFIQGGTKELNIFVSDLIDPEVTIEAKNKIIGYNPTEFKVKITENETSAQLIYSIEKDGKEYIKNTNQGNLAVPLQNGEYTIIYYAQDLAGNKSTTKKLSFTIDKIAPIINIKVKKKYNPTIDDIEIKVTDNLDKDPKVSWEIDK